MKMQLEFEIMYIQVVHIVYYYNTKRYKKRNRSIYFCISTYDHEYMCELL